MAPRLAWICGRVFALTAVLLAAACGDSVTDIDTAPPGPVTNLTARVDGDGVRLSWSEPGDRDVAGSLLVRFPASGVDAHPEARRAYSQGDALGSGQVVYAGRAAEVIDSPPCVEHVYAAWARDVPGNWSVTPQTVRVNDLPGSSLLAPPSGLAAVIVGSNVQLSWTPAGEQAGESVRVVRRRGFPPAHAGDGDLVFSGAAASASDEVRELSPLVTWHYAAFSCNACGDCGTASARTSVTPTLMQSLAVGGFVIYWRHATAMVCTDRTDLGTAMTTSIAGWWRSCDRDCPPDGNATARQLSADGYAEAEEIGAALREPGIPFGRVVSSEFCRCTETAERMALGPAVETLPDLTYFVHDEQGRCTAVEALLARAPDRGTNTALIGHINFLFATCSFLADLHSGEAAIFRPDAAGGFTFIARVLATEWADLP